MCVLGRVCAHVLPVPDPLSIKRSLNLLLTIQCRNADPVRLLECQTKVVVGMQH